MTDVAYNSGRRAFLKGWHVCLWKPADLRLAWNAGWQYEQDELEASAR